MSQAIKTRTGGHVVAESLQGLGAEVAFGLPGVHALAIWEGLRTSEVRCLGFRTELNAGFAADGYARVSGKAVPLLLSTGPGALNSLTALMEAATAHVPVVAIASQIPRELIGRGRGYLHELPDQLASFAPVVKWAGRAESPESIPTVLAEAWGRAMSPPSGPVFVEVPVDVLTAETDGAPADAPAAPVTPAPSPERVEEAAALLAGAERPVLWAGGGVLRSRAEPEVAALAERLDAPVATTYMGKGAFPGDHSLAAGSACDEGAFRELLESADVLLCIGTELGAETTGQYGFRPRGRIVQIDAAPERIGTSYEALGLVGDAAQVLRELLGRVPPREPRDGADRAAGVHERIQAGLEGQGRELERGLLAAIRRAVPRASVIAWDMTILAYWAAAHFPVYEPRTFLYPLGSGTLGYAWPAALGAAVARPGEPVVAVAGDGGLLYGLAELAVARQYGLRATLLVVDDGGYGILREYQRSAYGETAAVDLEQPDFQALARAFGVRVESTTPEDLGASLSRALASDGPAVVYLPALLEMWSPTAL